MMSQIHAGQVLFFQMSLPCASLAGQGPDGKFISAVYIQCYRRCHIQCYERGYTVYRGCYILCYGWGYTVYRRLPSLRR